MLDPLISVIETEQSINISFVWVCTGRGGDLASALRRYLKTCTSTDQVIEFIVVNNDIKPARARELCGLVRNSGVEVSLVHLYRKTAESQALSAAFQHVKGEKIVVLPTYIQSEPTDLWRMIEAIDNGLDYVASWRTGRVDRPSDQSRSTLFNWITRKLSGVQLHDINSGLRVMRRDVIYSVPLYGDLHIYLPVLAALQGFRVGEVPVRHLEERESTLGSGLRIYMRRGLDLLTLFFLIRFTQKPFRFFGGLGTGLLAAGSCITLMLGVQRILGQALANRPMLILGTLLVVLGVQLFSIGLLGELMIFVNAGGMKDYQIDETFESDPNADEGTDR